MQNKNKKSLSWKCSPSAGLIWGLGIFFPPHVISWPTSRFWYGRFYVKTAIHSVSTSVWRIRAYLHLLSPWGCLPGPAFIRRSEPLGLGYKRHDRDIPERRLPSCSLHAAKSSKMERATSIKAALNTFLAACCIFLSFLPSIKPFRSPRDCCLKSTTSFSF